MSYRVRDEEGNTIPDKVYGGDLKYGRRREYGSILNNQPSDAVDFALKCDHNSPALERGRDRVDALAYSLSHWERKRTKEIRGIGKTTNQYGEEKVMGIPVARITSDYRGDSYGGARNEGKSSHAPRYEHLTIRGVEEVALLRQKTTVHLETDSCGRYNYAKAFMYREVETKRHGRYREQIVGYGVSRRQHGDPKDTYVGEGLAVSRALEDLGYKVGRRSWGKVKHNDDIKVQRRQQKIRRQAKAEADSERFATKCTRKIREVTGL